MAVGQVVTAASSMVWKEVALEGNTAHSFEEQITALEPFLGGNWKARVSAKKRQSGLWRRCAGALSQRSPLPARSGDSEAGGTVAEYDLVIASQPIARSASLEFKASACWRRLPVRSGPGAA